MHTHTTPTPTQKLPSILHSLNEKKTEKYTYERCEIVFHLPLLMFAFPYKFSKSFLSRLASKREYKSYKLDV